MKFDEVGEILADSRLAYAKLGISVSGRRRSFSILMFLTSVKDVIRFLSRRYGTVQDSPNPIDVCVCPDVLIRENEQNSFVSILGWEKELGRNTIFLTRSGRDDKWCVKAPNVYDLTVLYGFAMIVGLASNLDGSRNYALEVRLLSWILKLRLRGCRSLFVSDWNNSFAVSAIIAAKAAAVKTVELQHGVIHDRHPAYSFKKTIPKYMRCDRLLYWYLPRDRGFLDNIYSEGEISAGKYTKSINWNPSFDGYRKIVISLQRSNDFDLLRALSPVFANAREMGFDICVKPRGNSDNIGRFIKKFDGVRVTTADFYNEIASASLHISHSSTTVIESAISNIPTIIFDFDNKAFLRNSALIPLTDMDHVFYITRIEQLRSAIGTSMEFTF